jgi:transcriptional regulator GlxA family with amidase domain
MTTPTPTLRVGIWLYPDVEVLDFAGPYEVFTTASRMAQRLTPGSAAPFEVCTVARQAGPVRARAGLQARADHGLHDHPPLDVLVVPGGVVTQEVQQADTLAWLAQQAPRAQVVASVCTGAFLLAAAGLLPEGMAVTTHWEDVDDLRQAHPGLQVDASRRYIDQGAIATSAGISAGIDLSLHLVARLAGLALAERTARQMDVVWTREPGDKMAP